MISGILIPFGPNPNGTVIELNNIVDSIQFNLLFKDSNSITIPPNRAYIFVKVNSELADEYDVCYLSSEKVIGVMIKIMNNFLRQSDKKIQTFISQDLWMTRVTNPSEVTKIDEKLKLPAFFLMSDGPIDITICDAPQYLA